MKPSDSFFAGERFAIFGARASGRMHGDIIIAALRKAGRIAVAIEPEGAEVKGAEVATSLAEAREVSGIVIVTPSPWDEAAARFTSGAVGQCKARGIKELWIDTAGDSKPALAIATEAGFDPVIGACPCLYIAGGGFPHGAHRWLLGAFGKL
jgi:predicted CoA-binding protein